MDRKQRAATESFVLLLIIAGIAVAANAVSGLGVYKRIDTTKAEKYTLSKGSGNLLRSMKSKMTVDAYVTKGLPKLDAFVRDLRDLLQEYKNSSGGKFDYQLIEAKDEEQKKKAKDAGLQEMQIGEAAEGEEQATLANGYMGLVINYGTDKEVIPALDPGTTEGLEFWLTNKMRELHDRVDDLKHRIGVLTGHDEIKLTDNLLPSNPKSQKASMQDIVSNAFKFYKFEDVDLKNGDNAIDDGLDGIIVTQPGKDLSEKELRRLDQFVLKGKSLVVFASAVNIKPSDATMNATLNTHGLEKLLGGYGIEMHKDVVLDFAKAISVGSYTQAGLASSRPIPTMLIIGDDPRFSGDQATLDPSFPPFFRMQSLVVPLASSLTLHPEKQPDLDAKGLHVVMRSTPRAVAETGDSVDLKPLQQWRPKGKWDQFAVAAVAEGKLKTAFPDGDKQGVDLPAETKPGRVFVLASSEFTTNPFARAGNGPDMSQFGAQFAGMGGGGDPQLERLAEGYVDRANIEPLILAFKNTLDWLTGDTDLLAVSAKIIQEPHLTYGDVFKPNIDENMTEDQFKKLMDDLKKGRKTRQGSIQWTLILGLPLLLVAYGILRWRMRIAARENVSLA